MITSEPVISSTQVELLRYVRNACSDGFSHDNTQISWLAQRAWWVAMRGRLHAWLYYHDDEQLVGYGLVRQSEDGHWWNSLAVLPDRQGLGIGSFITADLLVKHHGVLNSSVRRTNEPAVAMHHADDWDQVYGPDDNLIYFRSKRESKS